MKNIYLAGPVSGREREEVAQHFYSVESKLMRVAQESNVYIHTLNPIRFCPNLHDWHGEMRICVGELIHCHGIALLQGWQQSRGATLELKLAQDLHIPVVYVEPPLDSADLDKLFAAAPETLLYYCIRLSQLEKEGVEEPLARERALAELSNRYLDPHGFEYIDDFEEE